ncbi:MAG: alpha,alpha-trehalose-phosphate synthase (UDP-forming), partial [Acidimicrobiales bacterium]
MSGLIVASNRGPFSLEEAPDGSISTKPAGGGLAPSLAAALAGTDAPVWVAAAMTAVERRAAAEGLVETDLSGLSLRLVDIEPEVYQSAYDTVANATLWFLHHGLFDSPRRPVFDRRFREAWDRFRSYNMAFAEAICEEAAPSARVLVNDYHLPLVGKLLAEARPDLLTVHFTHTPFATPEELAMLPRDARRELIEGMAGFGACGFHTRSWEASFRRSATEVLGRPPVTFSAGLGADVARLTEVARSPECAGSLARLEDQIGDRKLLFRSDRVELSKNILRGFLAFDALLEERPEWRGRVCLVARAYASREGLPEYLAYRAEAEHLAAVVNDRWSFLDEPVIVFDIDDDFASTVAALRRYDVLLVNPLRDGMNLVAKEGPALNERDGVLVLSEQAGAYAEMGAAA